MEKTSAESQFEAYRRSLLDEITRLATCIQIYIRLHEHRGDRLAALNTAPEFFTTVLGALLTTIVLWTDKLFCRKSEHGLEHFLAFIKTNIATLDIAELKRRKGYSDDHWMLQGRESITSQTIKSDRRRLQQLKVLPAIRLRRNKFHAHFDKEYFFDKGRLATDAPLRIPDLEELISVATEVVNRYSTAYDGVYFRTTTMNATDIDELLDIVHEALRQADQR